MSQLVSQISDAGRFCRLAANFEYTPYNSSDRVNAMKSRRTDGRTDGRTRVRRLKTLSATDAANVNNDQRHVLCVCQLHHSMVDVEVHVEVILNNNGNGGCGRQLPIFG